MEQETGGKFDNVINFPKQKIEKKNPDENQEIITREDEGGSSLEANQEISEVKQKKEQMQSTIEQMYDEHAASFEDVCKEIEQAFVDASGEAGRQAYEQNVAPQADKYREMLADTQRNFIDMLGSCDSSDDAKQLANQLEIHKKAFIRSLLELRTSAVEHRYKILKAGGFNEMMTETLGFTPEKMEDEKNALIDELNGYSARVSSLKERMLKIRQQANMQNRQVGINQAVAGIDTVLEALQGYRDLTETVTSVSDYVTAEQKVHGMLKQYEVTLALAEDRAAKMER